MQTSDQTERMLLMVAAVQVALSDLSLRPTVVGGLAVEYYTSAYTTSDIDVLLPSSDEVKRRLADLGFEQTSDPRVWAHRAADVEWEMPGSHLDELDQAIDVEIPDRSRVLMLRCEDVLVHRIEEFVGGGHADVFEQAIALLGYERLDMDRVRRRAAATNHDHAVDVLIEHHQRLMKPGSVAPETWELHKLANDLATELARKNRNSS